jgi:predicted DNA-binding transcriptional regulator AlpA
MTKSPPQAAIPQKLHIDKRADALLATSSGRDEDDLLSTIEVAAWLGVSTQWLEIARLRGFGPPFTKLGPRTLRYYRKDVLAWLRERAHRSTSEYAEPRKTKAGA